MTSSSDKGKIAKALDSKPQKPLNGYFQYRMDKLAEYKKEGHTDRLVARFNLHWKSLSDKERDEITENGTKLLDQYKVSYDKWLNKHDLEHQAVRNYLKEQKGDTKQDTKPRGKSTSKGSKSRGASKDTSRSKSKKRAASKKNKDTKDTGKNKK